MRRIFLPNEEETIFFFNPKKLSSARLSLIGGWLIPGFCLVGDSEWSAFRDVPVYRDGKMLAKLILLMEEIRLTTWDV